MKTDVLNLKLSRFYTVEEIDISIKGITVLAGPLCTGKDKVLNFIYDIIRFPVFYEKYRTDEFWLKLEELYQQLSFLCKRISPFINTEEFLPSFKTLQKANNEQVWIEVLEKIELHYYDMHKVHPSTIQELLEGTRSIYPNDYSKDYFMHLIGLEDNPEDYPVSALFAPCRFFIHHWFASGQHLIKARNTRVLLNYMREKYAPVPLPGYFELSEENIPVIGSQMEDFGKFGQLKNVLCIESARFFGTPESWYIKNWEYVYEAFLMAGKAVPAEQDIQEKLSGIIRGEVLQDIPEHIYMQYEPLLKKLDLTDYPQKWFKYKRGDGVMIPLFECSYDIKKFILLERLVANGLLDRETLLIFNNPENYLTLSQIENLAEIIVLLHKQHGVRFLLSCYNPEMIKALEKSCKRYKVSSQAFNTYEATPGENPFRYKFK